MSHRIPIPPETLPGMTTGQVVQMRDHLAQPYDWRFGTQVPFDVSSGMPAIRRLRRPSRRPQDRRRRWRWRTSSPTRSRGDAPDRADEHTRKDWAMAQVTSRSSTSDPRQQLAEAIATKKEQLRRHGGPAATEATTPLHEQYFAVGKVVEALGLLDVDTGELETLVKLGIEAQHTGGRTCEFYTARAGCKIGQKTGHAR